MARFSIGTAIGDGFDLIRKRPLAVFVWGLLLLAPVLGSFALLFPAMGEMIAAMPEPGERDTYGGPPDQVFARMMQVQMASMLLNIGMMLIMAVIYTAVFRAVLRPDERSAFSLRLGMDELRVAVVGLAIGVGLYAAMLLLVMVAVAVGIVAWSADNVALLIGTIWILVAVSIVAFCFGLARVSMMAPASVLYRDFAFVQGWRLGAGNALRLFGMMIAIILTIILIEVVLIASALALFGGLGGLAALEWVPTEQVANPFLGLNAWLASNWGWALLGVAPAAFLYGLFTTISIAPFASACRQLAEGGVQSTPGVR